MNKLKILRQQAIEPKPDDRVGLPSTDLHDRPRPTYCLLDPLRQRRRHRPIAKFIHVLHERDPHIPIISTI